ncbi:MAG: GNAT family N-acetyltransferase [Patescibacteria group bacterium]|nr:GNAT family N-acetyltransferase [Patescibacteria group bacterium]
MNGLKALVRGAIPPDVPSILELNRLGYEEGDLLLCKEDEIRALIGCGFVAVHEEKVIGCLFVRIYASVLNGRVVDNGGRWCEIRTFYVLPEFRRMGVGSDLIGSGVQFARRQGIETVMTVTRKPEVFGRFGFSERLRPGQQILYLSLKSRE